MFKKILCPVGFDGNSLEALAMAAEFARRDDAMLYVVHALPPVDPLVISAQLIFKREEELAREKLEEICKEGLDGIRHERIMRTGNAAHEIIAAAADLKTDLIVMATHGRTGVPHLFLGSVAERVVREAPCPVLTVRAGKTKVLKAA